MRKGRTLTQTLTQGVTTMAGTGSGFFSVKTLKFIGAG
jgi:hypothetical protein